MILFCFPDPQCLVIDNVLMMSWNILPSSMAMSFSLSFSQSFSVWSSIPWWRGILAPRGWQKVNEILSLWWMDDFFILLYISWYFDWKMRNRNQAQLPDSNSNQKFISLSLHGFLPFLYNHKQHFSKLEVKKKSMLRTVKFFHKHSVPGELCSRRIYHGSSRFFVIFFSMPLFPEVLR